MKNDARTVEMPFARDSQSCCCPALWWPSHGTLLTWRASSMRAMPTGAVQGRSLLFGIRALPIYVRTLGNSVTHHPANGRPASLASRQTRSEVGARDDFSVGYYDRRANAAKTSVQARDLKRAKRSRASGPNPTQRQILDLQIILDAVFRSLAAQSGLFHAAEGGDLGRDDAFVDADDAVFQRFGDAEYAANVPRVEI